MRASPHTKGQGGTNNAGSAGQVAPATLAGNNGAMIAASAEIYVSALKVIANGR